MQSIEILVATDANFNPASFDSKTRVRGQFSQKWKTTRISFFARDSESRAGEIKQLPLRLNKCFVLKFFYMESIYLSKILGPFFLILGLGILLNKDYFLKLFKEFFKHPGVVFFVGLTELIFGLVVAVYHNIWVADWPVLITIIGWGAILEGGTILLSPKTAKKLALPWLRNRSITGLMLIGLIFGLALTYAGYFL